MQYPSMSKGQCRAAGRVCERSQVDVAAPAGAIVSTAEDVALWMQFLLKGGRTSDGRHFLTEEDLVDMFGNQMHGPIIINDRDLLLPTFPISDVIASYGFGWVTSIYRGTYTDLQ